MIPIPQRFNYFDTAAFKEPENKATERQDTGGFQDKNIYCAICGYVITSVAARFKKNGAYEHTFTNPHGYVYTITCFKNAPGAKSAGDETEEYTWFPGYAWSYALCGQCTSHLGWIFAKQRADKFYGLISDRISGKKAGS